MSVVIFVIDLSHSISKNKGGIHILSIMHLLTSLMYLASLGATSAVAPQKFADLPYDDSNHLVGHWVMFREASSEKNLCRDEVFLNPNNWLHRGAVSNLFNLAYLTKEDYDLVIENEIGK